MTDKLLIFHNLQKHYQQFQLGTLNLALESGYVYGIMGRNGSGKTTLFRLLNGIIQPDQGRVSWFAGQHGVLDRDIKDKIAYLPDELDIPDEGWSLADWRQFVSPWYPDWNSAKYQLLLERYELDEHQVLNKSSRGTRKKAALAIALAQEPQVMLLDEPSAGLDPFAWKLLLEDLNQFMAGGDRSIIISTHIMEEIRRLADYVIFMDGGMLWGPYEKDELHDSWRVFWLKSIPPLIESVAGVVQIQQGNLFRVISNSPAETEAELNKLGWPIDNITILEIDEIFSHVVRMKDIKLGGEGSRRR